METRATPAGHIILLDGKPLNLPGGELILPCQALAEAIAAEWADAGLETQIFALDDLALTRLAGTAQYRVRQHRADMIREIAAYGTNDLLCYRAGKQADLALRQDQVWQPWLDWAERAIGVLLATTNEPLPIAQPPEAIVRFFSRLGAMTDYQIAGLGVIVPALGSLILGLAVAAGALPPEQACELAQLEELAQERSWGADAQMLARREKILEDVAAATRFMVLCGP